MPNLPVEQVFRSHFFSPLDQLFHGQLSGAQARRAAARRALRRRLTILKKSNVKLSFQLREAVHKCRQPPHNGKRRHMLRMRVSSFAHEIQQYTQRVNLRFHARPSGPQIPLVLRLIHPLPLRLQKQRPERGTYTRSP